MDLQSSLAEIGEKYGAIMEDVGSGTFKMVFPVPAEPEPRSQLVIVREITGLGFAPDSKIIAFASVVGKLNKSVDLKTLLRESENMIYAKISLDEEEHVVVYSFCLAEETTSNELEYILRETAWGADRIEEIFFKSDKN